VILVVVNLDDHERHAGTVHLDLDALGITAHDQHFSVHDLLGGATYRWVGPANYVDLDPAVLPAHVLHVRRWAVGGEREFDGW